MANNAEARARLAKLSRDLRALPAELAHDLAPVGAAKLDTLLRENISAGVGPDGKAWPLRQDGGKALPDAGDHLTVRAVGTVILARLEGPPALHHLGIARGRVVRQIIPTKAAPQPVLDAITAALPQRARELLGLE